NHVTSGYCPFRPRMGKGGQALYRAVMLGVVEMLGLTEKITLHQAITLYDVGLIRRSKRRIRR
ncbi:hypothetical protein, partial [Escherichia coli]